MFEEMRQLRHGGSDAVFALASSLDGETIAGLTGGDPNQVQLMLKQIIDYQNLNRMQKRALPQETRSSYEFAVKELKSTVAKSDHSGLERYATNAQMREIDEARESGLLKINHDATQQMVVSGSFNDAFGEIMRDLISSGKALLLDDQVGKVVRAMVSEGYVQLSSATESRSVKANAGTSMIARLPVFHEAEVGKILEVRSDLDLYLSRYRRAVREYGQKLESAPFTPELQDELTDLWLEEIQPSVLEIQSHVSRKTIAKNTAWEAFRSARFYGMEGAASLLQLRGDDLGLDHVAAAATSAATAVAGISAPFVSALKEAKKAKEHDLFYLATLDSSL